MHSYLFIYFYHGKFYHIGSSALYGRVNGITLCKTTYRKVGAVNVFQPALAAHQGFYITIFFTEINSVIHVFLNVGKLCFIIVYYLFCFGTGDTQIFCQTKSTLPVYDTKIYTLGFVAHFFCYFCFCYIENFCCCSSMNIFSGFKSFAHIYIGTYGSHNA